MGQSSRRCYLFLTGAYRVDRACAVFLQSLSGIPCGGSASVMMEWCCLSQAIYQIHLFVLRGQRRFDFINPLLTNYASAYLLWVDGTKPEVFREARSILLTLRAANVHYVLIAFKQTHPDAWSEDEIRIALRLETDELLFSCDPHDSGSSHQLLAHIVEAIV